MQKLKVLVLVISIGFLASCGNNFSKDEVTSSGLSAEAIINSESGTNQDQERQIIKTAQIDLKVENLPSSVEQMKTNVNRLGGRMYHLEMKSNRRLEKEIEKNLDSNIVMYQVVPTASLKMKVPAENADSFVSFVLKMNASIDNLMMDEEDITERIMEKKELSQMETTPFDVAQNIKQSEYEKTSKIDKIQHKVALAKLNHQIKYLWFDVNLSTNASAETEVKASFNTQHAPFYVGFVHAINNGWHGLSIIIIALLNVWPFWILIIVTLLIFKKKAFQHKLLTFSKLK